VGPFPPVWALSAPAWRSGTLGGTDERIMPGYTAVLGKPSRINLPWQFSDTTGHRLRVLYGITDLA
jgi:hypothetical protein